MTTYVALTTVREINDAVYRNVNNRGGQVYASIATPTFSDKKVRIIHARTVHDVLQVKRLNDSKWYKPERVWHE